MVLLLGIEILYIIRDFTLRELIGVRNIYTTWEQSTELAAWRYLVMTKTNDKLSSVVS